MSVIDTVEFKKTFRDRFSKPEYAFKDNNDTGFVHCGTSLFKPDAFRITEGIPLDELDTAVPFKESALAVEFVRSVPGDYDNEHHGDDSEIFVGNHMIHTVVIQFLSNPNMSFEYNGKVYRIPSIWKPAVDYDLKELVFWWVLAVLEDNKQYKDDNIEWSIHLDAAWTYENLAEFSGFSLEILVGVQIKQSPHGGND